MRANKAKNTGPELALRRLLREQGLTGYKPNWKSVNSQTDEDLRQELADLQKAAAEHAKEADDEAFAGYY